MMRSGLWVSLCLACALGAAGPVRADVGTDFKKIGEDMAAQIILNPSEFLYDIQMTTEDRTPLPGNRVFSFGTNIFPNLLPFTELSGETKTRLHREHGGWPQVDLHLGAWDLLAGSLIPKGNFEGSIWGIHGGLSAGFSLDPRLRAFFGYQFSSMFANFHITPDSSSSSNTGTGFDVANSLENINTGRMEHYMYIGGEMFRSPTKRLVAELGFGLVKNKLVMRLTWASRNFDTGLAFYPEGAWVLWPFANFQVRF